MFSCQRWWEERVTDDAAWLMQCWFYLRLGEHPDLNYYAYPLDLCAEVNEDLKVTKVYRLPLSPDERISNEQRPFDLERIHPAAASEYHPDLRPNPRTTTMPYQVVQPEGPSFSVEGQKVSWEKWSFRVGFNYREGLTLHDIRYDDRSLFLSFVAGRDVRALWRSSSTVSSQSSFRFG